MKDHAICEEVSDPTKHLLVWQMSVNASIMILRLPRDQISAIVSPLAAVIIERPKTQGIFVFLKEILNEW